MKSQKKMTDIKLTHTQIHWLDSRGGRNASDVEQDEDGLYVLMGNGRGGEAKVYLPN